MTIKKELQQAYDMLEQTLNIDGDWHSIACEYEDVMIKVMDILNELIKRE